MVTGTVRIQVAKKKLTESIRTELRCRSILVWFGYEGCCCPLHLLYTTDGSVLDVTFDLKVDLFTDLISNMLHSAIATVATDSDDNHFGFISGYTRKTFDRINISSHSLAHFLLLQLVDFHFLSILILAWDKNSFFNFRYIREENRTTSATTKS